MNHVAPMTMQASVAIALQGDVQGSGIRPAIANLAMQYELHGSVRNTRQGVSILVAGDRSAIAVFEQILREHYPHTKQTSVLSNTTVLQDGFKILNSSLDGSANFVIPLDRVVCQRCLEECQTRGDRRFGYPLNSCPQCGPRYSIINAMPYDRTETSMARFTMCGECLAEYSNPSHRRFHAQTNCCPKCGPQVWYQGADGTTEIFRAIEAAAQAIASGKIVAVKGLGGYQLLCDATNQPAVVELRRRKGRPSKPLALMVRSLTDARALAAINPLEVAALTSNAGPIVILDLQPNCQLSSLIYPGLNHIGLMLPTTAMHAMLLDHVARPMVVTSGNREGEPLEYDPLEAQTRLASIADGFLHHDRPIVRPIDDSVVRCMAGQQVTLRAARGIAPLPLDYNVRHPIEGMGGQQKSAIALSNGHCVVLGPHLGDLYSVANRERFLKHRLSLKRLMTCEPTLAAYDEHPDYFSSVHALQSTDACAEPVQHHHAHVAAAMLQHGWIDREVLGFAFDGTGFGGDRTVWGGEVLVTHADKFKRVAHLRPFPLVGQELAATQPWRVAAMLLKESLGTDLAVEFCQRMHETWQVETYQLQTLLNLENPAAISAKTSSMGRLFDGVSAIVCGMGQTTYEGEAAMRLEAICDRGTRPANSYALDILPIEPWQLDWRPLIRSIVQDLSDGVDKSQIAMKYHRCIAEAIWQIAERFPHLPVVLTGGVFQNRILVELVNERMAEHPSPLGLPGQIPPNDGGLAAGQLVVAAAKMARRTACA
ncbi:MAG: carbamoyltransferase HypF [Pirellulaceae bacterium]